ncbi:MAG: TraR/DksA C4-type zinc finger protein [Chthoniobacteraceae bacterium]
MPKSKPAKFVAKTKKPIVKKAVKPAKAAKPLKVKKARPAAKSDKAPKPAKILKLAKPAKPVKVVKANGSNNSNVRPVRPGGVTNIVRPPESKVKLTPFLEKQKERLIHLRDSMMDSMMGVAKDTLRSRAEGSEASAFGMHQADAGSDAYDRDFALSLLSQEQDALYEIEQALGRINLGTYGVCEMTGKPIAHPRLEAIPFARYTVECQSQLEKQNKHFNIRKPVTSLFGLTDEEPGEAEEEEPVADNKE